MITLSYFFYFSSNWCSRIVSGEVRLVLIILFFNLVPSVPIDATGTLFKLKI